MRCNLFTKIKDHLMAFRDKKKQGKIVPLNIRGCVISIDRSHLANRIKNAKSKLSGIDHTPKT